MKKATKKHKKAAKAAPKKGFQCETKCPNCDHGACYLDVGHTGFHCCSYDGKYFSSE